jgi:hypothetical protein
VIARDLEDRRDLPLIGAVADERAVAPGAQSQQQRVKQDGLARTGFAGQHRQADLEAEVEALNENDVPDREAGEHSLRD